MSLDISGLLFSGDNKTGNALLMGVGHTNRYSRVDADLLKNFNLYAHVESIELFASSAAAANLILLKNDDFSGPFAQVTDARQGGDIWADTWGHIGSVLLNASNRQGKNETRLSFRTIFLDQWRSFLDNKLAGSQASREGDPTLTWEMFPENVSWLDPNLTYLKIFQPLHISIDWWPDYSASMTYHIYLYVTGDHHLRAWGARWAWWVESGLKAGRIGDELGPQVSAGLGTLQDMLNNQLTGFDGLLGRVTDVYYLPDNQVSPAGTGGIVGDTGNDITIVIEH